MDKTRKTNHDFSVELSNNLYAVARSYGANISDGQFMQFINMVRKELLSHPTLPEALVEEHAKNCYVIQSALNQLPNPEQAKLLRRYASCNHKCSSSSCIFNPDGVCLRPMLGLELAVLSDKDGCLGWITKKEARNRRRICPHSVNGRCDLVSEENHCNGTPADRHDCYYCEEGEE